MSFNVNEFKAQLQGLGGHAVPSLFEVIITPPPILDIGENNVLRFFCMNAQLPGVSLNVADHKRQGYGVSDKRVTGSSFENISLTFILDGNHQILKFFQNWFQYIAGYGYQGADNAAGTNNSYPFEIAYKKDYQCTIDINFFSPDYRAENGEQNGMVNYKLRECFPTTLSPIELAWENNNTYSTLPIGFSFRDYTTQIRSSSVTDNSTRSIGVFESVAGVISAVNLIRGLRFPNSIQDAFEQVQNLSTLTRFRI